MYEIVFSKSTRSALKRLNRSGSFARPAFVDLLDLLAAGNNLPAKYKDHQLKGKFGVYRECHLAFDLLVMYERDEVTRTITIMAIGTHDDLF